MGKRTEQIFFERGNTTDTGTGNAMANINNHQGNTNLNCNEISPYALHLTPQNGYHQNEYTHTHTHTHTHTQTGYSGWGEKEHLYTVDGNVNQCSYCAKL